MLKTEAPLFSRVFDQFANGLLIYVIFCAVAWGLIAEGGSLLEVATGAEALLPEPVDQVALPFLASGLAAFLAHAGLRWLLKQCRLRLSTSENAASRVFFAVLSLFALSGTLFHPFDDADDGFASQLLVLAGAWAGVMARRRIAI